MKRTLIRALHSLERTNNPHRAIPVAAAPPQLSISLGTVTSHGRRRHSVSETQFCLSWAWDEKNSNKRLVTKFVLSPDNLCPYKVVSHPSVSSNRETVLCDIPLESKVNDVSNTEKYVFTPHRSCGVHYHKADQLAGGAEQGRIRQVPTHKTLSFRFIRCSNGRAARLMSPAACPGTAPRARPRQRGPGAGAAGGLCCIMTHCGCAHARLGGARGRQPRHTPDPHPWHGTAPGPGSPDTPQPPAQGVASAGRSTDRAQVSASSGNFILNRGFSTACFSDCVF